MPQLQQVLILKTSIDFRYFRVLISAQDSESFAPLVVYFSRCQGKCPREHIIIAFHVRLDHPWGDVSNSQAARQARIQACVRLQCWSLYGWADLHFCVIRPFSCLQIPAGHQGVTYATSIFSEPAWPLEPSPRCWARSMAARKLCALVTFQDALRIKEHKTDPQSFSDVFSMKR